MSIFQLSGGLPAALALRLGIVAVTLLASRQRRFARHVAFFGAAIGSGLTGLIATRVLQTGTPLQGLLFVHQASSFALTYTIDGLSAWFLLVLSVVAVPIAVFSVGYIGHSHFSERSVYVGVAFNLLLAALEMVFTADGVIAFVFAWELFTLVAAALVATDAVAGRSERRLISPKKSPAPSRLISTPPRRTSASPSSRT
jgi:hydrogenase-4 component B